MKPNPTSKRVAVLYGGRSAEHEISILSALQAISALDSLRYDIEPVYLHPSGKFYVGKPLLNQKFYREFDPKQLQELTLLPDPASQGFLNLKTQKLFPVDIYFLCFHGQYGEDGCIQGLLEMKQAPYTGCNLMASSLAMNKYFCKLVLKAHDIPTLPHVLVKKKEALKAFKTAFPLPYPLFVKPCHLGSSIGISRADDEFTLKAALAKVFFYDDEALIEPCLTNLMEINISVLDGDPPVASVLEMPVSSSGVLSYEDKYLREGSKVASSQGMASLTRVIDPEIDPELKKTITRFALEAFSLLGCSGVVRFDFMVDLNTLQIYFNELNPIPGSLAFYLWEKSDPPLLYTEVLNQLLEQALAKRELRLSLKQNLDFKAL